MPVILFNNVRLRKMQKIAIMVFFTLLQGIKYMHSRTVRHDLLTKRCYEVGTKLLLHAFLSIM